MTRICPKCSYVRKPSDEAPEWQCPSCKIAFVKAGGQDNAGYGRPTPIVIKAPASGGIFKWIVVAALFGACVWVVKPAHHAKSAHMSTVAKSGQPVVILYGTEWCGYCKAAREYFDANGIQYTDIDVERSTEGYEQHKKLGGRGVPLIVIGEEVIHGFSEEHMQQSLGPWLKKT